MRQMPLAPQFDANAMRAKPFVKWVGGKRSLLPQLLDRLPAAFNNYYEPFLGGGALFFALRSNITNNYGGRGRSHLSDINPDLITAWQVIRDDIGPLIARLKQHAAQHSHEYYYALRQQHQLADPIERAARLIYLNKTCYNGLWRVNSKGEFNVPLGRYKNPSICQETVLRACHAALQGVNIHRRDFRELSAGAADFVYFDPPYQPLDKTSFTRYAKDGFGAGEQEALRDLCLKLHSQGAKVLLSNSDASAALYQHPVFRIEIVKARRAINSNPKKRGAVKELLIRNY